MTRCGQSRIVLAGAWIMAVTVALVPSLVLGEGGRAVTWSVRRLNRRGLSGPRRRHCQSMQRS
jgi:hypothetical protein